MAARWAGLLVDYCLRVERGETIVLSSSVIARPLVEACFKAIVGQGGHPLLRLEIPGLHEYFLENASDAQLSYLPPEALFEAQKVAARIRIAAESDIRVDEPGRPSPAGGLRPGARPHPPGRAARALGLDPVPDARLTRTPPG